MAQTVLITLTTAGADTGPFDLYSNADGYAVAFEVGVAKASLTSGYVSILVPDLASIIRVKSTSVLCTNYGDLSIVGGPTTTTTSTSTSTTTTTVAPPPSFYDHRRGNTPSVTECSVCPPNYGAGLFYTSPGDTIPTIGMVVYTTSALSTPFNGGNTWWAIEWDGPSISTVDGILVDSLGVVTDTHICSVDCP